MVFFSLLPAHAQSLRSGITNVIVLAIENQVEVMRRGAQVWDRAFTNQLLYPGDRLRTGLDSRALLRRSDLIDFPVGELTQLEIPVAQSQRKLIKLFRGMLYFFHRDRPGEFQMDTPTVSAVVRGTEFNVEVVADGTTTFQVLEGMVDLRNEFGQLALQAGDQGMAAPGEAPRRTAAIITRVADVIQWCLYYPGVLYIEELRLSAEERAALNESLGAYRRGDLTGALASYPAARQPASDAEKIYRAALLLAVGKVSASEDLLGSITDLGVEPLRDAVRTLIAAVKLDTHAVTDRPLAAINSPTAWLAESYWQQSRAHLDAARAAARRATSLAPDFAFAWTQLAELEFGFGRVKEALQALEKSLRLAPRNAQALALKGFLLAAQHKIAEAIRSFDEAILTDGALGNAWLGRGLCRIRQGRTGEGRADLQVAATLEPQRSLLRSYLGKAFSQSGDADRALHELELARQLDASDPTSWLYAALIKQQQSRINEAVRELEQSEALNENRRIYRSRLLLDQDQAVRGANLAAIYADANMQDVSLREAARAVNTDYANYSAHLFLGESFNALRDPRQFNLRYETPWLSEYLVANLLAPVAAGALSPYVTQQEYGRLFERDRLGFVSTTEYWSRGDWAENAVHYGILGDFSYALEGAYRAEHGSRPNNDLEEITATVKLKQQVTPQDVFFFQGTYFNGESGDLAQYYNASDAQLSLRVKERQEPLLLAGWHHEWSPQSHTLLLAGHWFDTALAIDTNHPVLFLRRGAAGNVNGVPTPALPRTTASARSEFDGYTAELQQMFQLPDNTVVFGARFQSGGFTTRSDVGSNTPTYFITGGTVDPVPFPSPAVSSFDSTDFQRLSFYGYDYWQVIEPLLLSVGLAYDQLRSPLNLRYPPISAGQETIGRVSPKAGAIWTPLTNTTFRAAYSQSLSGVSFDQSFQLEPSQVAGFNQAYRSLIAESVGGALSGARFETIAVSLEQKFFTSTYFGAQAEWLKSKANRTFGAINLVGLIPGPTYTVSGAREHLDYDERNVVLTLNQLVGNNWSFGARYRCSEADLESRFAEIPLTVTAAAHSELSATLHQVNLFALFNHESGFFSQFDSIWSQQSNRGYLPDIPGDDFWQFNIAAGYRFLRRRIEARVALLNLAGRDYQLNPLTLTRELPRQRTLVVTLRLNF